MTLLSASYFRNIGKGKSSFMRGYGFQGGGGRSDWGRGVEQAGFGADFKKTVRDHAGVKAWYARG